MAARAADGAAGARPTVARAQAAPVLVAGAGPVGLATAAWLAEYGVPVRVVDAAPAPSPNSRAFAVWRRTLAALAPLVPPAEWGAAPGACEVSRITMVNGGRLIGSLALAEVAAAGHALPVGLLVSQAESERLLEGALRRRGVAVERGVRLAGFRELGPDGGDGGGGGGGGGDDGGGVECVLVHDAPAGGDAGEEGAAADGGGGGREERVRASYLVGADGAHSAVRHGLGVEFPGVTLQRRFWMADARYEAAPAAGSAPAAAVRAGGAAGWTELLPGALTISTTSEGLLGAIRLEEGMCRVILDGGEVAADAPRAAPPLELFAAALRKHTRLGLRLTEGVWLTEFRVNERVAARYQSPGGRVLLAGDAAHVHSPAGGQGMNLGLMDATNLAWKLALVHGGDAGPQLLGSYEAERRPAALDVVRMSGTILRTALLRSALLRALRAALMGVALRVPALQRWGVGVLAGDGLAYTGSPLAGTAAARSAPAAPGHLLPDIPLTVGGERRPATDLAFAGEGGMGALVLGPAARRGEWPGHMGRRRLAVWQVGVEVAADEGAAALVAALGIAADEGALVRPDGAVAASGGPGAAREWLARHVGGGAAGGSAADAE